MSGIVCSTKVADAFVLQYHILRASPENLHKFYKVYSIIAHPGSEGTMVSATTMQVRYGLSYFVVMTSNCQLSIVNSMPVGGCTSYLQRGENID